MQELLLGSLITLCISFMIHLALLGPAMYIGLVDIPQGRKTHQGAVPLIGGFAMFCAYLLSLLFIGPFNSDFVMLLVGVTILVVCGLIDDFFFLAAASKLFIQICVGLLVIISTGAIIGNLGMGWLLYGQVGNIVAAGLTLSFMVGSMNAFNMIDGADGLAGGLALISAGWLALAAFLTGRAEEAIALALLATVILGFLAFNARLPGRRRASAFMGDSGSLMLGCLLAAFAVRLCGAGSDSVPFIALLWVFALPATDAGSVIIRRIAAGRSPFRSDSRHIHQLCQRDGWPVEWVVSALWAVSALCGGVGVLGWWAGVPDPILLIGLVGPMLLHAWFVRRSARLAAFLRSWGGSLRVSHKSGPREA